MRTAKFVFFAVLIGLIFTACSAVELTPTVPAEVVIMALPTHTPETEPTLTATAISTATITPTAVPTQTATPSPTPTPDPTCPEAGSAAPFTYPADTTELQASMLAYLNAGGQWQDLFALLDELEIEHDWIQADMNGDGVEETAVYAKKYLAEDFIPDHAWWIFQCGSNQHHTILNVEDHWAFHSYFIADDLNNDNREEIIAVSGFAGTGCALGPRVWSLQGEEIVDLSPKYGELELGCSLDDKVILQDIDSDHLKEMTLIGDTVGHLDNAPQRYITQTFTLENTGYKLISTEFSPSDIRVHILDDAQRALDNGNISSALENYNLAAYDDDLFNYSSHHFYQYVAEDLDFELETDFPEEYQRAFALFRLAVIHLALGNTEDANIAFNGLTNTYSKGEPGYEFVVLTQIFFDAFTKEKNLDQACDPITQYIIENYSEDTTLMSHFYWGLNVAWYDKPELICPIITISANEP